MTALELFEVCDHAEFPLEPMGDDDGLTALIPLSERAFGEQDAERLLLAAASNNGPKAVGENEVVVMCEGRRVAVSPKPAGLVRPVVGNRFGLAVLNNKYVRLVE